MSNEPSCEIQSLEALTIRDGLYELHTGKEILKVKKSGPEWRIEPLS